MRRRAAPRRRVRTAARGGAGHIARAIGSPPYELEGLRLGDSREAVLRAHADLHLRPVLYEDPLVGTDYALTYGRAVTLRYEGDKLERQDGQAAYDLAVRLTGDDRLYSVVALVSDPARSCARAIEDTAQRSGAPVVEERPLYALWRDPSMLGPELEFRCLGDGLYRLELSDLALARSYEEELKAELRHAVDETLQVARGDGQRAADPPPFLLPTPVLPGTHPPRMPRR